jgi:hypothetical protein
VLQAVPKELLSEPVREEPGRWIADPIGLDRVCDAGVQALVALPAGTPWLRLLADQTAKVLAGVSHALNGLALLVGESSRPMPRHRGILPNVPSHLSPDRSWLPPRGGTRGHGARGRRDGDRPPCPARRGTRRSPGCRRSRGT